MTESQLKDHLRANMKNRAYYGSFGEYLFERTYVEQGHNVQQCHCDGFDFLVNGTRMVDVKSQLKRLDLPAKAPKRWTGGLADVDYVQLHFNIQGITIYESDVTVAASLGWQDALRVFGEWQTRAPSPAIETANERLRKEACRELEQSIASLWGERAKVQYRANPKTQATMEDSGWGAHALWEGGDYDVKVVLYFDRTRVYRVRAYPTALRERIPFKDKPIGKDKTKPVSFDPNAIDARFNFSSIDELMSQFPLRFPKGETGTRDIWLTEESHREHLGYVTVFEGLGNRLRAAIASEEVKALRATVRRLPQSRQRSALLASIADRLASFSVH